MAHPGPPAPDPARRDGPCGLPDPLDDPAHGGCPSGRPAPVGPEDGPPRSARPHRTPHRAIVRTAPSARPGQPARTGPRTGPLCAQHRHPGRWPARLFCPTKSPATVAPGQWLTLARPPAADPARGDAPRGLSGPFDDPHRRAGPRDGPPPAPPAARRPRGRGAVAIRPPGPRGCSDAWSSWRNRPPRGRCAGPPRPWAVVPS